MTQHQADKLAALAKSHPVPSEDKLVRRTGNLDRMAKFYRDKAVEAPEAQAVMFAGFVRALLYAMTMIKMYRKLTTRLAEIVAEGEDDASRTDSKSR